MKSLPPIVWVLLGLLVLGAAMMSLGTAERDSFPSASSFSPSGSKALADLLSREGYKVSITLDPDPILDKEDVMVAFKTGEEEMSDFIVGPGQDKKKDIAVDFFKHGGKVLQFDVPKDFNEASKQANRLVSEMTPAIGQSPKPLRINLLVTSSGDYPSEDNLVLGAVGPSAVATAYFQHDGTLIDIADGIIATNRFLDQNDNASEALGLVRAVTPAGAHIVFAEATFGNAVEPGVLELVGQWALSAWWQLLILSFVILYTLGKPFGYPDEERPVQGGARDLVDAVAVTYYRSRASNVALKWLYRDCDKELRRKLKMPADAPDSARNQLLPYPLVQALSYAKSAGDMDEVHPDDAVKIANTLEARLREFLGEPARKAKRRKRS